MKLLSKASPLICGVLAAASIASAHAEPQKPQPFKFDFHFNPDELSTEAGANRVLAKLERAVKAECDLESGNSARERVRARDCVTRTMGDTVNKIGSSKLTSLYQSRAAG